MTFPFFSIILTAKSHCLSFCPHAVVVVVVGIGLENALPVAGFSLTGQRLSPRFAQNTVRFTRFSLGKKSRTSAQPAVCHTADCCAEMRLLVVATVTATLAHEAAAAHTYKYAKGALPVGNDVVPPQNLTLAAAEAKCSGLPACAGITFASKTPQPAGVVNAYFKTANTAGANGAAGWATYLRDDYAPNPMNQGKQLPGPSNASDPAVLAKWRADMQQWREAYRNSTNYSPAIYNDPQLTWTQTSYMQPQMHPCACPPPPRRRLSQPAAQHAADALAWRASCRVADDTTFYDPSTHTYTVQKWLDDVETRYGGVDSILMWPTCEQHRESSSPVHLPRTSRSDAVLLLAR